MKIGKKYSRKIKASELTISLPFKLGGIKFIPSVEEICAAWELYVELSTRVTVQRLIPENCTIRGALDSIYSLFESTREILRRYGPDIGREQDSLGRIAIEILNEGIRPFVSKWNVRLLNYEHNKPKNISHVEYERKWESYNEFFTELTPFQLEINKYLIVLATIAGIKAHI